MVVTSHQPDFLPWLGFFDRWKKSDLFVVLDDVQFIRRGWHHRDKIKTRNGIQWFTVPVVKKGRFHQQIKEVTIDNHEDWRKKHCNTLRSAYVKAPCFPSVYKSYEEIVSRNHALLIDLNLDLLRYCSEVLRVETPVILASTLKVEAKGTERLVRLVQAVGGTVYLTGTGARDYLETEKFTEQGIEVRWQDYVSPVYPQIHGEFMAGLSVIDFLMMVPDPERLFGKY